MKIHKGCRFVHISYSMHLSTLSYKDAIEFYRSLLRYGASFLLLKRYGQTYSLYVFSSQPCPKKRTKRKTFLAQARNRACVQQPEPQLDARLIPCLGKKNFPQVPLCSSKSKAWTDKVQPRQLAEITVKDKQGLSKKIIGFSQKPESSSEIWTFVRT